MCPPLWVGPEFWQREGGQAEEPKLSVCSFRLTRVCGCSFWPLAPKTGGP